MGRGGFPSFKDWSGVVIGLYDGLCYDSIESSARKV